MKNGPLDLLAAFVYDIIFEVCFRVVVIATGPYAPTYSRARLFTIDCVFII